MKFKRSNFFNKKTALGFLALLLSGCLLASIPFLWLDAPTGRSNPHDPKSPLFQSPSAPTPPVVTLTRTPTPTPTVSPTSTPTIACGYITTVAGSGATGMGNGGYSGDGGAATAAQLNTPNDVAFDNLGNLYITDSDNYCVRKMDTAGVITTVAGNGVNGYSGDGGAATAAKLSRPIGVAVDSSGNLYIADYDNSRIRKVSTAGIITTVAGMGVNGYSGDGGAATTAQLNSPYDVAVDSLGNLYIADVGNGRIRKVYGGVITTAAGGGFSNPGDLGPANWAVLNNPVGVAVDSSDNFYIADSAGNVIRKVDTAGIITTVAGNGSVGYSGDGGAAIAAQLDGPTGITTDSLGNLYIAGNARIRRVSPGGIITTVAGNGTNGYSGDGGLATAAQFYGLKGITVDSSGNLYIADINNHRVRKVTCP